MSEKGLVVITGAGSGIGYATAKEFHRAGHPLLLLGRNMEKLREERLSRVICRDVDVTDLNAFTAAVEAAQVEFGPVEGLVNNAGLMLLGQIDTQDPVEWSRMLEVNVRGVLNGVRTVLGGMRERRRGTVINLSSIAGKKGFPNHAAYTATKFAVHGLTENLREENAEYGVRFITVAPGVVSTSLLNQTTSSEIKNGYSAWREQLGTLLQPEELAKVIRFVFEQPAHITIREIVLATTTQLA